MFVSPFRLLLYYRTRHTHCVSVSLQLHHCIAIKPPIMETVFMTVIVAARYTQLSFEMVKETATYIVTNYDGGDHGNTSTRSQRTSNEHTFNNNISAQ